MSTGLREGSVLSPLLFILFMADMEDRVLRPFGKGEFLKHDPVLNKNSDPGAFVRGRPCSAVPFRGFVERAS